MTSTTKKGWRKEKQCRDDLINDGWIIVFKSIRWRFGTIDFAKLFDVVAYRGQERKYISCKHLSNNTYHLSHQEEIKQHKAIYGKIGESYELWLWDKPRWKGGGKNKTWNKGGWIKIIIS